MTRCALPRGKDDRFVREIDVGHRIRVIRELCFIASLGEGPHGDVPKSDAIGDH